MRKEPRQVRARATVDAILEAGARILGRQGWGRFTTNAVADIAGVSIGSLYQYFPNKAALVEAILRRHFDDVLTALRKANEHSSRSARIEGLISGVIAAHSIHPSLHRVLLEDVPRGGISKSVHEKFESEYSNLYTQLVAVGGPGANPRSKVRAQVLSSAIGGVVHDAARKGTLESSEMRQELIHLVDAYLMTFEHDREAPKARTAGATARIAEKRTALQDRQSTHSSP